ncbi:MAG: epoxyqueuosine reductase QueH [Elusimicrobiota bacterium]|jgi:predicted adenine nucleotide alpha hydrolase (AANH) superfamily ATPase|nr:epoxyqueuosine reductase QueH [Elusimicrobiota bacterium]
MKKLLLHICCAPCSAAAIKSLRNEFEISFFWYNPNIYDLDEYNKRKESAIRYSQALKFEFFEEKDFQYDYQEWKSCSVEKCSNCYQIRLKKTFEFAKTKAFDFFSTSLLSSPYQKHELIKEICFKLSTNSPVKFLYRDFREFFYDGKNELRSQNYYIQKYCACQKSYFERFKENKK